MLQPADASKVHLPSDSNINGHRESLAIKRRHMTFAEAEKERSHRVQQLALLGPGDIIGLDSYVCDLSTYMNSARCTAPCDLFYILKHNFLRLHKRHGTQGLAERLREIVRSSLHAYPSRILQLPLYATLSKKQLAAPMTDEQQQLHNNAKQPWLLHANNGQKSVRGASCRSFVRALTARSHLASPPTGHENGTHVEQRTVHAVEGQLNASVSSDDVGQRSGDEVRSQRSRTRGQTRRSSQAMACSDG